MQPHVGYSVDLDLGEEGGLPKTKEAAVGGSPKWLEAGCIFQKWLNDIFSPQLLPEPDYSPTKSKNQCPLPLNLRRSCGDLD